MKSKPSLTGNIETKMIRIRLGLGFRVQGFGFRVVGLRFRVRLGRYIIVYVIAKGT